MAVTASKTGYRPDGGWVTVPVGGSATKDFVLTRISSCGTGAGEMPKNVGSALPSPGAPSGEVKNELAVQEDQQTKLTELIVTHDTEDRCLKQ
jgi:hypothetical protein